MEIITQQNVGGTGFTTYTDWQLLIGSSKDNALHRATLTASTGISVVTGNGSITVSVTGPSSVTNLTANHVLLGAGTSPIVAAADWTIVSNILIGNLNTAAGPAAVGLARPGAGGRMQPCRPGCLAPGEFFKYGDPVN